MQPTPAAVSASNTQASGWWWAGLGMLCFSFTLPATRLAVPEFGSYLVGFGRSALAGVLALGLLLLLKEKRPERRHWLGLGVVALGTVFGFSVFSALALRSVPSSHGAVVVGLLPAATAIAAVLLTRERPRAAFWVVCALGVVAVLVFAVVQGAGQVAAGDIYLLLAVIFAAAGYAEGGRLAREMGGWRVVSWALAFSLPITLIATWLSPWPTQMPSVTAWAAFGYVSVFSVFLGFFAWYKGLALGGVARAGQVQLLQPVLTVAWSALLLGEHIGVATVVAAVFVVGIALLSRLTR
ncbi:DMT family transporter [Deinococcus psychrotolerans]|uniref:DMT family transporter n=1 Tax=Deinococcus psychrotolerans TaxID=2489213 RepID=A0A3G8YAJ9_9DEIO|nr:DMT family transporter [Deinococcus psychrotolerans]AZI42399.1 DMT family transporter [Deinococcus psychrotolerans]